MKNSITRTGVLAVMIITLFVFFRPCLLVAQANNTLTKEKIQAALDEAYSKFKDVKEGKNADYIKELAQVDPRIFGIAIVMTDGQVYTKGDVQSMVSIQSVS
ncbi:MAG: glutaminase, partial [Bacteroidota bacterium]